MSEAFAVRTPGAEREFHFSERDFQAIAAMLRADAGIHLPPGKSTLVYARLTKRLRAIGMTSFSEYVDHLSSAHGAEERRHMLTSLTTNVTRFFREPHHFEHLQKEVLPSLLKAAVQGGRRVRLWSAACSTGQEPYSIAAVVAELMPEMIKCDVRILATDIDPIVLEQARAGVYASLEGVPPAFRRWFVQEGSGWSVHPRLRQLVTFKELNLAKAWPVRGPFDAVLCRNVAIYFDAEMQAKIWQQFANVMAPGGMLYIGHSERINGPASSAFSNVGITAYQRRSAGA